MVSNPTGERKTIKIVTIISVVIILARLIILSVVALLNNNSAEPADIESGDTSETTETEDDAEPLETRGDRMSFDFQSIITSWAESLSGDKGIVIYDLNVGELVAEYNADTKFSTASLYKLYVVYEGYRRLNNGTWKSTDLVGSTGYTVPECLDLAIRESHSPCAETLWGMIGRDELNYIVQNEFELTDLWVTSLTATPNEIASIMIDFYQHFDIENEDLIAKMKDSFLNQPATIYNWRQGLPSGFSDKVNVYNKVGWNYNADYGKWSVYDDAAIVEFPESNHSFVVVVMTKWIDYRHIVRLAHSIEEEFNKQLVSAKEL